MLGRPHPSRRFHASRLTCMEAPQDEGGTRPPQAVNTNDHDEDALRRGGGPSTVALWTPALPSVSTQTATASVAIAAATSAFNASRLVTRSGLLLKRGSPG